jgi:hypothetical protein
MNFGIGTRVRDKHFSWAAEKLCSRQEQWTQYKAFVDQLLPLEQETQVE